jgi:Ca2+-transporting ATPase
MIKSVGDQKTPLEDRLERFGKQILWACLGLAAVLLGWGFLRGGRPWHELLLEAVSLAVAAIPEGLPAITTITLALGMQRMAKRGAIVRKLPAVETLGAATIIASDKTGTLTQNEMTVRALFSGLRRYVVTGEGYEPGRLQDDAGELLVDLPISPAVHAPTAALCTNAQLDIDPRRSAGASSATDRGRAPHRRGEGKLRIEEDAKARRSASSPSTAIGRA